MSVYPSADAADVFACYKPKPPIQRVATITVGGQSLPAQQQAPQASREPEVFPAISPEAQKDMEDGFIVHGALKAMQDRCFDL